MPNEVVVLALNLDLGSGPGGIYVFPTPTTAKGGPTTGAAGMLVYSPHAPLTLSPRQLIAEFGLEIVESLLLAGLLALVAGGFGPRVGAALLVGVVAAVTTNLSYWNWYGFPLTIPRWRPATELIKYFVAGVVIALVLGPAQGGGGPPDHQLRGAPPPSPPPRRSRHAARRRGRSRGSWRSSRAPSGWRRSPSGAVSKSVSRARRAGSPPA